jgi:deoxyribodipyrimidine photo-lyase
MASPELLAAESEALAKLPIDHTVRPVATRGGHRAAEQRLRQFMKTGLASYDEDRRHPDRDGGSGLSPYLHFGHLSAHQVYEAVARARGPRTSAGAEAFLDELITWRELGFNFAANRRDLEAYESLPAWARATLEAHAADPRPHLYSLKQLARSETDDRLWNAAQRQLVREGRMHGYLRMLWGKRVLEWSASPREALTRLIELNNRYALDGRDPNSYSGILWCFGRYDRPWGPERPIFGKVRYMSSANTARKLHVRKYLARYDHEALHSRFESGNHRKPGSTRHP